MTVHTSVKRRVLPRFQKYTSGNSRTVVTEFREYQGKEQHEGRFGPKPRTFVSPVMSQGDTLLSAALAASVREPGPRPGAVVRRGADSAVPLAAVARQRDAGEAAYCQLTWKGLHGRDPLRLSGGFGTQPNRLDLLGP